MGFWIYTAGSTIDFAQEPRLWSRMCILCCLTRWCGCLQLNPQNGGGWVTQRLRLWSLSHGFDTTALRMYKSFPYLGYKTIPQTRCQADTGIALGILDGTVASCTTFARANGILEV